MITITIDEIGQKFVGGHGAEVFALPTDKVQRASHVVPENFWLRLAFQAIRAHVSDTSRLAAWSRTWACLWRVNIVGGPTLSSRWHNRKAAIEAEIQWLDNFFLQGEIQ